MNGSFDNIYDFVNSATEMTESIFGQTASREQMHLFTQLFKDKTLDDIGKNHTYAVVGDNEQAVGFTSAGDDTTRNLKYALIGSGISKQGKLPERRCYLSRSMVLTEKVQKEALEYRQNATEVELMIKGIYNWMQTDPKGKTADPNAYELVELFAKVNNVKLSGGQISETAEQQLKEIWENRKNNFVVNGLGNDNLAYQICNDCYNGSLSNQHMDLASIKALQKMAAVGLWLKQEKRNGNEVQYNNEYELSEIENYINASRMMGMNLETYLNSFSQEINMTKTLDEGRSR